MMKKTILPVFVFLHSIAAHTQNFFYVEPGTDAENFIKQKLTRSSQFVTGSMLESEYIIKHEISIQPANNNPTIRINVVDTMTLKTIYHAEEAYSTANRSILPVTTARIALQTLIEKNLSSIIFYAKHDSLQKMILSIGPKKDKT